jgi:uncharacterized protein with ParB-like and HNH nuclease domain/predicted transport protein
MKNIFEAKSLNIREIFGNVDSLYQIPRYQRPYKWEDDQIDKLWDDIFEAFENEENYYFLGSIIVAKSTDNKTSYWDVVDGQQRLTTLIIFFRVVSILFPDINKKESDHNPNAINKGVLENSIYFNPQTNRIKLATHPQHASDFDDIIIKGDNSKWKQPPKYLTITDESPKYKFLNAACSFKEKLEKLGEDEASKLIDFLFNSVYLIRINCTTRDFAIRMFQVLNDRGLDLTPADLIKSFLLGRLENINKTDLELKKLKEDQLMADWNGIEEIVKGLDVSIDELLVIYEYYFLEQNPKKSLYEEFENKFQKEDPNKVIGDFKKFSFLYKNKIHDSGDNALYGFWYLRWSTFWKSILLAALHNEYADYKRLEKALLRFYYLYWIAGKTLTKVKQISFNTIKWVKEKKNISEIEDELNWKIDKDNIFKLATASLESPNTYNTPWIKPLLLMIEYNQTDRDIGFVELSKDIHIEHVLPLSFEKFKKWTDEFTDKFAKEWINRPGNLTLLGGAKNIEASNNIFEDKIKIYRGRGLYGEKDTKITAFTITQKIVNDYDSNKYSKKWNENAILDRWSWFQKEVEKLLDFKFDSSPLASRPMEEQKSNYTVEKFSSLGTGRPMHEVFEAFRDAVLKLDSSITQKVTKKYVAYKTDINFVAVLPHEGFLWVMLYIPFNELKDPKSICQDVSGTARPGKMDSQIKLSSLEDLPYVMELVSQAFDRQKKGGEKV